MISLAALLSLAIGVVLGILGGGGAILTLPMLVYAVDVDPKAAIAMSLFVVGSTSGIATIVRARSGKVEWRIGLAFGAAAMLGAFGGGRLAAYVPANVLLVLFAMMMLVTAVAMLKGRTVPSAATKDLALGRTLTLGAVVGALSGLVGAGGGFLIVPALAIVGGLPMDKAIATSLFVITVQSFAGFAGHVGDVALDGSVIAVVTSASVSGMFIGTYAGQKVSANNLRRGFAWLVLAMGLFVIAKQAPIVVTAVVATVTVAAVLLVTRPRPALAKERPCTTSLPSRH